MADPITRSGSNYSAPRDSNRVPVTFGVSTVDGITPVALEVNPSNGQLQTSGSGGGGGGTQYQELATTSPATGTLALGRYQTSLPTLTNGQMNEPMLDSSSRLLIAGTVTTSPPANASTNIAQFGGSSVTIGQQLAAASIPVILPAATITTLTPPAAITNYALETGGNLATIVSDLTNASQKTQIVDGSGNVIASTANALDVFVSGGVSGTQYAEGATTSPGTGTLALGRYSSPTPNLATGALEGLQLDSAGNLLVNVKVGGTSGSSTVTAGDVSTIAGAQVQTTADGIQAVSLAGPTGDLVDTIGNSVSVAAKQQGTWVNSNNVEVPTFFNATENSVAILCKVTPGYLLTLTATNYNSTRRYFQIFNQQTLPVQGNIPLFSRPISGGSPNAPGSLELGSELFGVGGLFLSLGVAVGISTSANIFIPAAGSDHTIAGMFV